MKQLNIQNLEIHELSGNSLIELDEFNNAFIYLIEGNVNLFHIKSKDGINGRQNFINNFDKNSLIPNFSIQDENKVVLSSTTKIKYCIISNESLKLQDEELGMDLVNDWILKSSYFIQKDHTDLIKDCFGSDKLNLNIFIDNYKSLNDKILSKAIENYSKNLKASFYQLNATKHFKDKTLETSFNSFKKIIPGEEVHAKSSQSKSNNDLLFQLCQLIGEYEKINFSNDGRKNKNLTDLQNILKNSRIRSRNVSLGKDWWNNNNGALLGYLEDDTPIAIIPKNDFSNWLVDIKNGKKIIITQEIAKTINKKAICFYTPLESKSLTGIDLIKFASKFALKDLVYFIGIGVVSAIFSLILPIATGYIFNEVIPSGSESELFQIFIILISIAITIAILNFAKSIAILRAEGKASYKVQSAIWDRILSIEVEFFKKFSAGDLAQRSMGIEQIRTSLSNVIVHSMVSAIFSIFYLMLLFYYDWLLALTALGLGLVIVIFTITVSFFAYKYIASYKRMEAIISGFLMQMIGGIQKIRVTDSKNSVFAQWAGRFTKQKDSYVSKRKLLVWAEVFRSTFPIFGSLIIFIHVFDLNTNSSFSIGDFVAFNTAFGSFQGALLQAAMATVPFISIKPTFELLKPILEAPLEDETKDDPDELSGLIEVNDLKFKYSADQSDWILKGISLKINPGEMVAFVGTSGSGKSTLMRLLLGFEKYNIGSILLDGKELSKLNIRSVREQFGVVLQDGKILQGSILFNIIGNSTLTEEDAWRAAKMAGCDKDIEALPQKMHTILPAGGGTMSGGQQQRIVIARSLVRNPKLFIFDEATSALDNETQAIVSESVNQLKATRILIAHRLSTIKEADKIFVMDQGKIIESGNYQELMDLNGFFTNLAKRQLS